MLPLLLLGCTYEVPLDPDAPAVTNVIAGTVVLDGAADIADTVILLYAADNPPPPTGTGRPASFATVPASAFSEAGGVASASWALTEVPDGEWLITALVDVDGNFQPLLTATAGSTCGDWLGAYFTDFSSYTYAPVSVAGGRFLDGVTVAVGRQMPTERPAWTFTLDDSHDSEIEAVPYSAWQVSATAVHAAIPPSAAPYDLDGPFDGTADCQTTFWTYVTDADGDGEADPHPNENFAAAGLKDFWPRVYLRYLADPSYVSEAIPMPAAFGGGPAVNTPTPANTLDLLFAGKVIHVLPDGTEELIDVADDIPRGDWSVTVVQFTGQTWTLPNELAGATSTDASFDATSQGLALTIE